MLQKLFHMVKGNLLLKRIGYVFRILFVIKPRLVEALGAGIPVAKRIDASKPLVVVPLLETNHFQHRHILLMAQGFVMRGYEVLVVVCDEYLPACELKSSRNVNDSNPCFECITNRTLTLGLYNLNYITLSQVFCNISDPVAYGMSVRDKYDVCEKTISRIAADSVTRYFYGAEIDADQNDSDQVRDNHLATSYISLALGDVLLKEYRPSICFNNMNVYSAWGPLFNFLESRNVAPITLSMTPFNLHAIRLNNADLFRHKRTFHRFLNDRGTSLLNRKEISTLETFLQNRISGNDDLMKEWEYFQPSAMTELMEENNKKNVVLFPNIPWDQGLTEFESAFTGVIDWVEKTIEYFAGHPDINIWIKPHPAEVRGTAKSGKSVSEFIKMKYPVLPDNVFVINAELGVNPYQLFPFIDVGVILSGTLGLEMALQNIDVVSAGTNPCYGLGLLSEPANDIEYFKAIESGDNSVKKMDELMTFSYFYFIHQCFDWPLTERAWGDDSLKLSFSKVSDLGEGKMPELDTIFDEIEALVSDFRSNQLMP